MTRAGGQCRACGVAVTSVQRFCPACGELYPLESAEHLAALAGPLRDVAAELRPMLEEKGELGARLEALATAIQERGLTADERRDWELTYTRWRDLTFEITLAIDAVHRRAEGDRRVGEPEPPPDGPLRSGDDRRDPFWTRAP